MVDVLEKHYMMKEDVRILGVNVRHLQKWVDALPLKQGILAPLEWGGGNGTPMNTLSGLCLDAQLDTSAADRGRGLKNLSLTPIHP